MSLKISSVLATSLILSSTNCFADLAEQSGFEFIVNLNLGMAKSTSQLSTDDDNEVTKDLNNGGQDIGTVVLFPLARLSYTLESKKTQLFIGNSKEQVVLGRFKAELGASHELSNGIVLTAAYIPMLLASDEWQDPFLTQQKRETTDVESHGVRLRADNLFSIPLSIEYIWAESDYKNELSGQQQNLTTKQQQSLQRDAMYHHLYVEYTQPLSQRFFIQPAITFLRGDSEGDAMSFDEGQLQASFITMLSKQSQFITTAYIGRATYDQSHPIFDTVREDDQYGLFAFYSYSQPLNWENSTFTAMLAYDASNSNISFYDANFLAATVGMAYKF